MTFNWKRPATPNGIITQYRFDIEVDLGASTFRTTTQLIDVTPNQNKVSMTVAGLSPYHNYTATVSATTVVGYGPSATIDGRTDPDSKYVLFIIPIYIHFSSII